MSRHQAMAGCLRKQKDTQLTAGLRSKLESYYPCYSNQNAPEVGLKGATPMTVNGTYAVNQTITPPRGLRSRYMGTSAGSVYNWLSLASPYGRITDDFTMCCWVNMASKTAEMGILSRYQATMEEYILTYDNTSGKFRWYIYSPALGNQFAYSDNFGTLSANTWYFLTVGFRNFNGARQMFIAVNDKPYNVTTLPSGALSYANADFRLGRYGSSGATGMFQGNICHFMKFSKAISEQEKNLIYNQGMVNPFPFNR